RAAACGGELGAGAPPEPHQAGAADELPGHAGAGGDPGERAGGDREVPGALALDAPGAAVAEAHLRSRALAEPVGDDSLEGLLGEHGVDVDGLDRSVGGPLPQLVQRAIGGGGQVLLGAAPPPPAPDHGGQGREEQQQEQQDGDELLAHRATTWPSRTVGRPASTVRRFAPGSSRPAKGELRLSDACSAGSATRAGRGSHTSTCAGEPGSSGRPWSSSRPISAGFSDSTRATSRQLSRPSSTIVSCTSESAVSRPVMPIAAWSHSRSLASRGWGAWSVATMSMVPSARPSRTAATSSAVRSGGLTLKTASNWRTFSSVSSRWCGVTSAVTAMPRCLAQRMMSTLPAVARWHTCRREPTCW